MASRQRVGQQLALRLAALFGLPYRGRAISPPRLRVVHVNRADLDEFPDNRMTNTKYTPWTFLPLNLYAQVPPLGSLPVPSNPCKECLLCPLACSSRRQ